MMIKHNDPSRSNKHPNKPFLPTCGLPKNAAAAPARMLHQLTTANKNPLCPAPTCPCDNIPNSAMHILLDCPKWTVARKKLFTCYHGPTSWTDLTDRNIRPKDLLHFMRDRDLIRIKSIITNYKDARDADYVPRAEIYREKGI